MRKSVACQLIFQRLGWKDCRRVFMPNGAMRQICASHGHIIHVPLSILPQLSGSRLSSHRVIKNTKYGGPTSRQKGSLSPKSTKFFFHKGQNRVDRKQGTFKIILHRLDHLFPRYLQVGFNPLSPGIQGRNL